MLAGSVTSPSHLPFMYLPYLCSGHQRK